MITAGRGFVLLMICALAACGEMEDDDGDGNRFDALEAQSDDLSNEVQDLAYTDPASLPTTGAATFEGVMGLNFESMPDETLQGYDMAGDLEMTVNFAGAGDQITGQAGGFVGIDGEEFDGSLIIDDGVINRDADIEVEFTYAADLAGELVDEDGTAMTVESEMLGDFAGDDHSHAFGIVSGVSCTDAACDGVGGAFVAER